MHRTQVDNRQELQGFCSRRRSNSLVLVGAGLVAALVCSACMRTQSHTKTLSQDEATEQLRVLARQTESMVAISAVTFPGGRLAYVKGRAESVGKLGRKLAVYSDGAVLTGGRAKERFIREYHVEWGNMGRLAAETWIKEHATDAHRNFWVWFSPGLAQDVLPLLEGFDPEMSYHPKFGAAAINVSWPIARILAGMDTINRVELVPESPKININSVPLPDALSAGYSAVRYNHNADGQFASGISVGVFEPLYFRKPTTGEPFCEVQDAHNALANATVTYLGSFDPASSSDTCSAHADCDHCVLGACVGGRCIARHASWVASRISSSYDGTPLMAAQAELVYHTDWNPVDFESDQDLFMDVYEDYLAASVYIVNESQTVGDDVFSPLEYSEFDHVRDYVARWEGVKITKTVGNNMTELAELTCSSGSVYGNDTTADCHSLNSICVGALNDQGTATWSDDTMACWSLSKNPKFGGSSSRKEAERPDVVTQGEDAYVMDVFANDLWIQGSGTSFAAPVIAGMIAVTDGVCGQLPPTTVRSALRTGAWTPTDARAMGEHLYPMPGYSPDSRAGAGLPLAGSLYVSCNEDAPEPEEEPEYVSPTGGSTIELELDLDDEEWFTPDEGVYNVEVDEGDTTPSTQGLKAGSDTRFYAITPQFQIVEGVRVRSTMSFTTCPGTSISTAGPDVAPIRDLDFVLCDLVKDPPRCAGISQSNDDTNEGFDVMFGETLDNVAFYLVRDATESGVCKRHMMDSGEEPVSISITFWDP